MISCRKLGTRVAVIWMSPYIADETRTCLLLVSMKPVSRDNDGPSSGDVLITSEEGLHFLSAVPHPHSVSFTTLSKALQVAMVWAHANGGDVWRKVDGRTFRMLRVRTGKENDSGKDS